VGVCLALLLAQVAFAGGAEAAATTRSAPFTVDTNLKLASGFTADELNAFVKKYEASSPLAKYGTYFVQAEQKSNVNAQGLLAIAINQTAWGTAGAATDNNFFAIKGKKYSSASAGILDGAAWINKNYLTKGGPYYVSPTLKGMGAHYSTKSSWATQVAAIADRMRGAPAAKTPTAAPKAPTPCPPSSRTCKPAPAPSQAPQPQPSCVPAMKPQSGQGTSMALPCNPTPGGADSDSNSAGPNDGAAQGGVSLPPEGSDAAADSGGGASPAPAAGQNAGDQGGSGGSGAQATPAPSQSPASPGITMAGSVRRVAQSGGALVPLLFGLVLLIGGLVAVVIARRRPTF
jgi:hypothetical protein